MHIYQGILGAIGTMVSLGIMGFMVASLVYIVYDKIRNRD